MPIPAIEAYKTQIGVDITTKTAAASVPPDIVGSGFTDLANLITPYLETEENRGYTGGTAVPSALDGANGDVYFQGATSGIVTIYQKVAGAWVAKGTFNIDGKITVSGTSDASGNYNASASGVSASPNVTIYDVSGNTSPATYNKTTKIISGLNASEAFSVVFR